MNKQLVMVMLLLMAQSAATDVFKRYQIKTGMILYDVSTTGTAPGLTTKTNGIFRLVFDDWGAKELKEEDLTEIQTGDFYDKRERHSMTKLDYGTVYTVNFDENLTYQTRDSTIDMAIAKGVDMSDQSLDAIKEMKAKKIGTDTVVGYKCDIWQIHDQIICMHKGIPLSVTIKADGFTSTRIAQVVNMDKALDPKEFELPRFDILSEQDYRSNKAASVQSSDYIQAVDNLKKDVNLTKTQSSDDLTQKQINTIIDSIGAPYLRRQKKYLPTLLKRLDAAKDCIKTSEDSDSAKQCIVPVNEINDKLGDTAANYDYRNWDDDSKEKVIKSMNKEIKDLKVTINCVEKSKKTTDVIICTEGSLKPKE